MRTIRNFERALGRLALWSPHRRQQGKRWVEEYVPRLRVHPHALREANAYYSPTKKALLFGYFPAAVGADGAGAAPLTVFTCLSQDIVAHEVTHALLDGIHRRFNESSNPDVLAFHEAFADIVALFQHFSLPDVLRHQIAATRGDLASQNQLGELAQQFGQAIGKRGALRSAIGEVDETTGEWRPREPDPEDYRAAQEPHDRGSILVAAVFDAFLTHLQGARRRPAADRQRGNGCASGGAAPSGSRQPARRGGCALAHSTCSRCASARSTTARRSTSPSATTCARSSPRTSSSTRSTRSTVGSHSPRRSAATASSRTDVRTLSVDGLLWRPAADAPDEDEDVVIGIVKSWAADIGSWNLSTNRKRAVRADANEARRAACPPRGEDATSTRAILSGIDPELKFEVHSIRPSLRTDWNEQPRLQWVIELTQRIPQYADPAAEGTSAAPDYYFRGGCTLLVDAETGKVRYSIKKPLNDARKERQRRYLLEEGERKPRGDLLRRRDDGRKRALRDVAPLLDENPRVRMYRQGLGDCFLLTYSDGNGESHLLIDCGVLKGTAEPETKMQARRAERARRRPAATSTGSWSRTSTGITSPASSRRRRSSTRSRSARCGSPGRRIPTTSWRRSLRQAQAEGARRNRRGGQAGRRRQDSRRGAHRTRLDALLDFQGDLGAAATKTTAKALEWVKSREAQRSGSCGRASSSSTCRGCAGLRVYVLGPPHDRRLIKRSDPEQEASARSTSWPAWSGAHEGFLAAAEALAGDGTPETQPFDEYFRIDQATARKENALLKHYYASGSRVAADRRRLARLCRGARAGARLRHEQHEPRAGIRAHARRRRAAVSRRRPGRELALMGAARMAGRGCGRNAHGQVGRPARAHGALQGRSPRQPQRDLAREGPGADGERRARGDDSREPRDRAEDGLADALPVAA